MSILTEVEEEIVEMDRKDHKDHLRSLVEIRDKLREKFYAAREKVGELANMSTAEYKKKFLTRSQYGD